MVRKQKVKGHKRRDQTGKIVKVRGFKRKRRPTTQTGIHKAETRKFRVTYYRDSNGRLVSKRIYKKL